MSIIIKHLEVNDKAIKIISDLKKAGFEAYIVGGAVRDLLLGNTPKDFDIATSAKPEEVRKVFGRRNCRVIGKRFRLAHVFFSDELYEVSTFRRNPLKNNQKDVCDTENTKLIIDDNTFGTAFEDAWRRDFTINALFYNPLNDEILDYTESGMQDIDKHVVRAIGVPEIRFDEDPVRMLRALKLVGMYNFSLDSSTENALFSKLPMLRFASISRLSLELEKILQSSYGDKQLAAFHDYGLLAHFLPNIEKIWDTPQWEYAMKLLWERNCRVDEGCYRNSVSLAMALLAYPVIAQKITGDSKKTWNKSRKNTEIVKQVLINLFEPQKMIIRVTMSAEKILELQSFFFKSNDDAKRILCRQHSYPHSRELALIRFIVNNPAGNMADWEIEWPVNSTKKRKKTNFFRSK